MSEPSLTSYARFFGISVPFDKVNPQEHLRHLQSCGDEQNLAHIFAFDPACERLKSQFARKAADLINSIARQNLPLRPQPSTDSDADQNRSAGNLDYSKYYKFAETQKTAPVSRTLQEPLLDIRGNPQKDAVRIRNGIDLDKLLEDFATTSSGNAQSKQPRHSDISAIKVPECVASCTAAFVERTMPLSMEALNILHKVVSADHAPVHLATLSWSSIVRKTKLEPCLLDQAKLDDWIDVSEFKPALEAPVKEQALYLRPSSSATCVSSTGMHFDETIQLALGRSRRRAKEIESNSKCQEKDAFSNEPFDAKETSSCGSQMPRLPLPNLSAMACDLPALDVPELLSHISPQLSESSANSTAHSRLKISQFLDSQSSSLGLRTGSPNFRERKRRKPPIPSSSDLVYRPGIPLMTTLVEESMMSIIAQPLDFETDDENAEDEIAPLASTSDTVEAGPFFKPPVLNPTQREKIAENQLLIKNGQEKILPLSLEQPQNCAHEQATFTSRQRQPGPSRTNEPLPPPPQTGISTFLGLRGRQFKSLQPYIVAQSTEIPEDPIVSSTQSSLSSIQSCSTSRCSYNRAAERSKPMSLGKPCTILVCNLILNSRPHLIQYLETADPENLNLVFRDLVTVDEIGPDIILSPTSCAMITTIQSLKQRPLPGQSSITNLSRTHDIIFNLARCFQNIWLIVQYCSAQEMRVSSQRDIDQLRTFSERLTLQSTICVEPVMIYTGSGTQASCLLESSVYQLILQHGYRGYLGTSLLDESNLERHLVQSGLNPFAVLIVISIFGTDLHTNGVVASNLASMRLEELEERFANLMDEKSLHKLRAACIAFVANQKMLHESI